MEISNAENPAEPMSYNNVLKNYLGNMPRTSAAYPEVPTLSALLITLGPTAAELKRQLDAYWKVKT